MGKYHNKKTEVDGIMFDSKKEASRFAELTLLEAGGLISNLELQPKYTLLEAGKNSQGEKYRSITYIADFRYYDNEKGHLVLEDVKGMKTDVYKLKKKLFMSRYPDIYFQEI